MADKEGPQASVLKELVILQLHRIIHPPPAPQNSPPPQNPNVPIVLNAPQAPEALHPPAPHMPSLNWSHFKPEYSGKPDENAEAHLLRTNDWMDTHNSKTKLRYRYSV